MRNRHWGADEDCSSTDGDGVSYALRFFFVFFSYTAAAMITAVLHTCMMSFQHL